MRRYDGWLRFIISVGACLAGLAPAPATAQFTREHDVKALRSFHGVGGAIKRSFKSDAEADAVFKKILVAAGLAGLEDRITFRASAETANAEASIEKNKDGNEERLIFYNPSFMQQLQTQTNNYWSMVAVLAHEIGHHVRFHTVIAGRDHEFELEADYQAGFILCRMGATLEQTQAAFRTFPTSASATHPGQAQRLTAAALGWKDGKCSSGPSTTPVTPPPSPVVAVKPEPPVKPQPKPQARSYSYVWDARPPDDWLALRSEPSARSGQQLDRMPNGTLLEILEQRPDNWVRVRVVGSGREGWALSRQGERVWIYCCRSQ